MQDQNKLQNKGYLFPNKNKNKATQPDFVGKANWKGEEISISAWEKISANGEKFLSISLSEKFVKTENGNNNSGNGNVNNGYNNNSNNTNSVRTTNQHPDNDLSEIAALFDDDN